MTKITNNMSELRSVANEVTSEIGETGQLVEESVARAENASTELLDILNRMQGVKQATEQIAAMNREQSTTILGIADSNQVIYDHSTNSQNIAMQIAHNLLELSKQMEAYRNTFFGTNIELTSRDIARITITDKLIWKWKVYNMILGLEKMDSKRMTSHKMCRLGKRYYSEHSKELEGHPIFKKLERPHQAVYQIAHDAAVYYKKVDIDLIFGISISTFA